MFEEYELKQIISINTLFWRTSTFIRPSDSQKRRFNKHVRHAMAEYLILIVVDLRVFDIIQ
jgi:hypothetical protein